VAVAHYRELRAWQQAMELVVEVYGMTRSFPKEEVYSLTAQLRRAAVSVASNIAEGQGRGVGAEFCHHLRMAQGSLQEVETQVLIAQRLGYVEPAAVDRVLAISDAIGKMIRGLHRSVFSHQAASVPTHRATSNKQRTTSNEQRATT
jgi:four helix bundle protein